MKNLSYLGTDPLKFWSASFSRKMYNSKFNVTNYSSHWCSCSQGHSSIPSPATHYRFLSPLASSSSGPGSLPSGWPRFSSLKNLSSWLSYSFQSMTAIIIHLPLQLVMGLPRDAPEDLLSVKRSSLSPWCNNNLTFFSLPGSTAPERMEMPFLACWSLGIRSPKCLGSSHSFKFNEIFLSVLLVKVFLFLVTESLDSQSPGIEGVKSLGRSLGEMVSVMCSLLFFLHLKWVLWNDVMSCGILCY